MAVIAQDFLISGPPTTQVANYGVRCRDTISGIIYLQSTIPFGNKWVSQGVGTLQNPISLEQPLPANAATATGQEQLAKKGKYSPANSTSRALGASETFTGTGEDVSEYPSVVVTAKTDQNGTLYVEFSPDGINWDSQIPFTVVASQNEVHRITVTRKYYRVRFVNGSVAQTYLRLQTLYGSQITINSALNSVIQRDADAIVIRNTDFNLLVAEGLYQNTNNTIKDGFNLDIDTASVPEDITNEGGTYAGFPTGTIEAAQIVVAGADTGTVYYSYMASPLDTDYTFGSKDVAGAGTYALGHNIYRCNFAYYITASATAFNAGDITIRNTPTTANVFCVIPAGYSQSYCSAYTVPYGSAIFLDRMQGNVRGSTSGTLDGFFWYREYGQSPRLRFPFELQFGSLYFDDIDYLIRIPQQTDIIPRVTVASANNLAAKFSYRIIRIKS